MSTRYFTPATYAFLRELSKNNNKPWWEDNKQRYVEKVQEPALEFIVDFAQRLEQISTHFTADTRVNGAGSLMRPYRDMRFSKGAPYKTNVGIQFRHESGADVHSPGFYLHLEPGESFAGVGLWRPETAVARAIRQAINDDPTGWKHATRSKAFSSTWSIGDEEDDRLKRVPKELDANHPFPEDLRLKSFTAGTKLTQKLVTSSGFPDDLLARFQSAGPYSAFLCRAMGLAF